MKRLFFGILAVISAAVVLVAVVLFVPPAFRLALRTADRFLPVTVGITEYHHVPGKLSVSGVTLATSRGTPCEVDAITIQYRALALLLGRIDVSLLEIEKPRITIQRSEDGELNLFEPSSGPEQGQEKEGGKDGGSWISILGPLRIREIRVAEGSVRFEDLGSGLALAWGSMDVRGTFSGRPLRGELNLTQGLLEASRGDHPPLRLRTQGRSSLSDGSLRVTEFRLAAEGSSVSVSGEYSLADEKLALEAELDALPLNRMLASFGVNGVRIEELSGKLEAEATGYKSGVVRADLRAAAYGQQARARLAGRLQEGRVLVESLDLRNAEATLTGEASWELETGDVKGSLRLLSPVLEDSFRPYGIEGAKVEGLRVDGTLHGTVRHPEASLQLHADRIDYRRPLLTGFSAEGGVGTEGGIHLIGNADRVHLLGEAGGAARISASLDQGIAECDIQAEPSLDLHGRLNLEDRHAELQARARKFSLSLPMANPIHSTATFSLTGEGSFRGDLDKRETWKGEANIESLRLSLPDLSVGTARPARVRLEQGRLEGDAELEANGSDLTVWGNYPMEGQGNVKVEVNGSLALQDFRLAVRSFLPILESMQGNLRVQVTVQGPAQAPRFRGFAELSEGSIHLALPAEREEEKPPKREQDEPDGTQEETQPREILEGTIAMVLRMEGALGAPSGSLDARLTRAALYGVPLDEVHLQAESRNGRQWNPQLQVRRGNENLTLQGSWEFPEGKISGSLRSTEIDLATLFKSEKVPIEGRSDLQGTIEGTVESPRLHLRAAVKSLVIQDTPVGDLDSDLSFEDARVSVRGRTDSGWFETSIHLEDKKEFSFQGSLKDLPVGPFLERANLQGWTGKASLSANLAGPLADFGHWEGEISLEDVNLQAGGVPLRLAGPVQLGFSQGRLTIPDTSLLVGGSPLQLQGSVGREIHLTLRGTLPLGPFASLIPWVRFDTARVETDLVIGGSLSSPLVNGTLHLEAGEVKLGALTYPIDSIQADLRAESNRFTLVSLKARAGDGEIRASGSVTVAPLSFDDVHLYLESVPVRLSGSLAARLRGDLALQGTRASSLLKGKLRILEARYTEDFNIAGMILQPTRPAQKRVHAPAAFLKNMRLEVHIKSGPDLIVRNNVAQVILSTDMDIQGTAANPVPLGTVKVEEGRVFFSKKEFEITQGSLSFIDPQGGPPKLQLESMVKVQGTTRQYTIYLTFTGPLDRIQLDLRSSPDLEREDIIFMLVTGKTRDEFYASSGAPTNPEETAQRLALSGVGFLIGSDVRHVTGLDTFELERTEGEAFGLKTAVGKRFNERVEVRGAFALGSGQQVSEAQVGYLLTDMFYVVGTQRTDGSFGLDFRIRFSSH
jgi:autotransporter translocation and assembly factor TamB